MKRKILYSSRLFDIEEIHPTIRGKRATFDRIRPKDCVVVIPFIEGKLVLEKQFRPVIEEYLIEFPAGRIEKGETPKQTAIKELMEETGYNAGVIKPIFVAYPSPGLITEKYHFFYAYNLKKGKQHMEPDEDIKVILVSPKKAIEMVKDNKIKDLKTIVGILLFAGQKGFA